MLAIVPVLALAGCNDPGGGLGLQAGSPARTTATPFGVDQGEVDTPNSLPAANRARNPVATGNGVIGVMHLP